MWILTGLCSIMFLVLAAVYTAKHEQLKNLFSTLSLSCTVLTLLLEYYSVLTWTEAKDWSGLQDAVPSLFPVLLLYSAAMIVINVVIGIKK